MLYPIVYASSIALITINSHDILHFSSAAEQRHDHYSSSFDNNVTGMRGISGVRTRSFSYSYGESFYVVFCKNQCT